MFVRSILNSRRCFALPFLALFTGFCSLALRAVDPVTTSYFSKPDLVSDGRVFLSRALDALCEDIQVLDIDPPKAVE